MPVVDADVVLAIWLDEPTAKACVESLACCDKDEPILISDFNALEVVLRSSTALHQSVEEAFARLTELCEIRSLSPSELTQVARFRLGRPSLTLGDAYAAALATCRDLRLISTDRRFAQVEAVRPLLNLVE